MKAKCIIVCVIILAVNFTALWLLAHHYEFHTGMDGQIIWRCNNLTGKVEYSLIGRNKWISISPSNTKLPNFGSSATNSKTFTFEEATNFQGNKQ
jgi:hypothetical protein